MRTITGTEPATLPLMAAWIETSPSLRLGFPNLPATKNEADLPSAVVVREIELTKEPLVPLRNTTAPPLAADFPLIVRVAPGTAAPAASVTRIWQGEGAQDKYRALGSALLLILNSTAIVESSCTLLARRSCPQDPGHSC